MKTPLNWISLYTPISRITAKKSIKDLAHEYSTHTAEIDGIEEHRIDGVVVGKVLTCEKHPDSTKLSICTVAIGGGIVETILTGAANIIDATYVPVAVVGTKLTPDFTIGERKMAGMVSRGMICGADEIGLARESDGGIMILESLWEMDFLESMIGQSVFDLETTFPGIHGDIYQYTLGDATFEIDNKFITNRPDLFGIYGNAREWGAVFDLEFAPYTPEVDLEKEKPLKINIETDRCLAYHALRMDNITVGKSPFGIQLMMQRAGLDTKMDIVDITNSILAEYGQPMHVFDADKVSGSISVRLAKTGEKILALNGIEYDLTPEDMVIADEQGPIAIAGVIGGMDSAVSESTTNIIWESATFDATSIRLTAQRHGIRTDASTRYEKSLDPLLSRNVLPRILDYLKFLSKNINITGYGTYIDEKQINHVSIEVSYDFINKKSGVQIPKETVQYILTKLGFTLVEGSLGITVTVPSWRASKDISLKEDIAEEVIRIYGYDRVALTPLSSPFSISANNSEIILRNHTLSYFEGKNWNEVHNYSFSNLTLDRAVGYDDMSSAIGIQNAFNESYTHMRRSLTVRLFENIANNLKHDDVLQFFELGKVYTQFRGEHEYSYSPMEKFLTHIDNKPFPEKKMLAGVSIGISTESIRRDIEGYLMNILGYIPPLHQDTLSVLNCLHPGISAEYRIGDVVVARFGQVHPETVSFFEIPAETLYFEIEYEIILHLSREREYVFTPPSRYQRIDRELNFVMPDQTRTGDVARIMSTVHPWIRNITVDSLYRDESKIGIGNKSVNFSFSLQSNDSTISDDEALAIQDSIIKKMSEEGINLRSI